MAKSCIILSQGPVPTPEHNKVEGGGLRCWGLAKGLLANDPTMQITVAYNQSYRKEDFTETYEGIKLVTWDFNNLAELISDFDSVLVSYCMADLSVKTADYIRPNQQLILDCLVPIYVEVSARDSVDAEGEFHAFHHDVGRWAYVLKKGDLFICASEQQKDYYKGVLSAVGRINPVTYSEDLIKIVPYGIYREDPKPTEKPITKLIGNRKKDPKKILWFGGIYPWFDIRALIEAVLLFNKKMPAELVIVGAKNPFNTHPDFVRTYDELVQYIESDPERRDSVVMQDWVQFDTRADWYLDSDLVVVMNKLGEENSLSWRTRLVDYLWADLPIITNGGDPLGEILLNNDAALRFSGLTAEEISADLIKAFGNDKKLVSMKANLRKLKKQFYWDAVTADTAKLINSHHKAKDLAEFGHYTVQQPAAAAGSKIIRVKHMVGKARMIPAYARKHGVKNTYFVIRTQVGGRLKRKLGMARSNPGIVMVSHQLDFSGAPYVFMDLAEEILKTSKNVPLEFHTFNPALRDNLTRMNRAGIVPKIHMSKDITIPFVKGDTVILNTVAHSAVLKNSIYQALQSGQVKKLVWFVHEDEPDLIFAKDEIKVIKKLLSQDKIVIFAAATRTIENYRKTFDNEANIRLQTYKYVIPERFQKVRTADNFEKLSFILPGTVGDGRKGQLPVFYALAEFYRTYFQPHPEKYRDFSLLYVGVEDDFLSRQMLKHAPKLLDKHFHHRGRVTHDESMQMILDSNITICYSLRECLPLFVFEGMAAGHPILRNDSSGMEEQLFPGENGFYLDSHDFKQLITTFEAILNKSKTSNEELTKMSAYANKLALKQAEYSYEPIIRELLG